MAGKKNRAKKDILCVNISDDILRASPGARDMVLYRVSERISGNPDPMTDRASLQNIGNALLGLDRVDDAVRVFGKYLSLRDAREKSEKELNNES